MSILSNLSQVQKTLKAPKNQRNNFGNYNYRSCEDILEALKGIVPDGDIVLLSDTVVCIGEKNYVEATASYLSGDQRIEVKALAREPEDQKGMSPSQITGSASSYARKYALNGLFAIDDTKDADHTNTHGKEEKKSNGQAVKKDPPPVKRDPNALATVKQKTEILMLLNNKVITTDERQRMKDSMDTITIARADAAIKNLKARIEDRESVLIEEQQYANSKQ